MDGVRVTDLLRHDHERLKGLLAELEEAEGTRTRMDLLDRLTAELSAHVQAEEELIYAELDRPDRAREVVEHARREQRKVQGRLEEVRALGPRDERFEARFLALRDALLHHIRLGESEVALEATRLLGGRRLEELGEAMRLRRGSDAEPERARPRRGGRRRREAGSEEA